MAGIQRFEDIEAWKSARELTRQVYAICRRSSFSKIHGLRDQIQRAAMSIMANIAEGFDGSHVDQREVKNLYEQTIRIKSLISGFVRYLRSKRGTLNLER